MRNSKTIGQICQEHSLDRGTLLKAAKVPHLLGTVSRQSGHIWLIDDESEQFKSWLARHLNMKDEVKMEEDAPKPTILEQTQGIRARYHRGEISPAEAKTLIKPYYDEYIKIAREKAKSAGMRMPPMSITKFLARRSDLRYVAQQQAIEQHQDNV